MKMNQQIDQVLRERARLYSQKIEESNGLTDQKDVLEFMLGNEHYGIPTEHIQEVQKKKHCTPLPGTPGFILGLINVRGKVLGLVDLKSVFGIQNSYGSEEKSIVIIRYMDFEFGIEADRILGKSQISSYNYTNASQEQINSKYIEGIFEDRLMMIDIKSLIESGALIVNNKK